MAINNLIGSSSSEQKCQEVYHGRHKSGPYLQAISTGHTVNRNGADVCLGAASWVEARKAESQLHTLPSFVHLHNRRTAHACLGAAPWSNILYEDVRGKSMCIPSFNLFISIIAALLTRAWEWFYGQISCGIGVSENAHIPFMHLGKRSRNRREKSLFVYK
jgi:hypothetical protein